ncbi:hypothetical protein CC79DRAFT_681750 [Sarocladium strictum]
MPRATKKRSLGLEIGLTEKTAFFPGDTIIGNVFRWSHIVDSEARLTIRFRGSAKVKIVEVHGSGQNRHRRTYRRRVNFFLRDISQELYRGPVHIAQQAGEPLEWPFALTIPPLADESIYRGSDPDSLFLKPTDTGAYELPATFASYGDREEFYVEYVLDATLRDSKGHVEEATLPITILRSFTPSPISEFGIKPHRGLYKQVSTFQLDPTYQGTELSFKQKAKEFFGSSKVPSLAFLLEVTYPSLVQLGHPEPVPFHFRAKLREQGTSEVVRGTDPALIVTRFRVKLKEYNTGIAPGSFSNHHASIYHKWNLVQWVGRVPEAFNVSRPPSRQPSPAPPSDHGDDETAPGESSTSPSTSKKDADTAEKTEKSLLEPPPPDYEAESVSDWEEPPPPDANTLIIPWESGLLPLDIGQALGIRFPVQPKYSTNTPHPDFTCVNIKTHHQLAWEMDVYVAGEKCKFEATHTIEILGPSDDDFMTR